MRIAVYPGSFDPMTNGHVDLVRRGCHIFDRVLVAVLCNTEKSFSGLLVDFLRTEKTNTVLRGLRVVSDFEYEFQMALMNRRLDPEVETVFLTPKEELSYLSSRLVKEVHRLGGDVSALVPSLVYRALREKLPNGAKAG